MADQPDEAPLLDVTALSDSELFMSGDSTLANVIKRMAKDLDRPDGEILSGFQSFAESGSSDG